METISMLILIILVQRVTYSFFSQNNQSIEVLFSSFFSVSDLSRSLYYYSNGISNSNSNYYNIIIL